MAAITLLTSGVQAASGTSTPLDVSAYTQIRGTISLVTDAGQQCDVGVAVEVAPTSTGPWREAVSKRFNHSDPGSAANRTTPNGSYPFTIGDVDVFARVKWSAKATRNSSDGAANMTLGVSGTGLP